jgi:hypothetical protein
MEHELFQSTHNTLKQLAELLLSKIFLIPVKNHNGEIEGFLCYFFRDKLIYIPSNKNTSSNVENR